MQRFADQPVTAGAAEDQAECRGAHQHDKDHEGELHGGTGDLVNHAQIESARSHGKKRGSNRSDAGGLGGRGNACKKGTEHSHHENQGRCQGLDNPQPVRPGSSLVTHNGGSLRGISIRPDNNIGYIEHHQHQTGQHGPQKKIAHRHADDVADQNQNDAGGE